MSSIKFQKTFGTPKAPAGPKTLQELKQQIGPLGNAAAERAEWGAVVRWLSDSPQASLDPAKTKREARAVLYYQAARSAQCGLPTIEGKPIEAEYLNFHRSRQSRIKKTASDLRERWEQAGRPCLDESVAYTSWYMGLALKRCAKSPCP